MKEEHKILIGRYVWHEYFYTLEEFLRNRSCVIEEYNVVGSFGKHWMEFYPVDKGDNFLLASVRSYDQSTGDECTQEIFILELDDDVTFTCMKDSVDYCLSNKHRIIYCKDYEDFF